MRASLSILAVVLLLSGCYKEGVGPEDLDHNPFDPAYNGEPVIQVKDLFVEPYGVGSETYFRLRVGFEVRTELLPSSVWQVWVKRYPDGVPMVFNALQTNAGEFYQFVDPSTSGEEYCWDVAIGRGGSWASTKRICVIAP